IAALRYVMDDLFLGSAERGQAEYRVEQGECVAAVSSSGRSSGVGGNRHVDRLGRSERLKNGTVGWSPAANDRGQSKPDSVPLRFVGLSVALVIRHRDLDHTGLPA